MGGTLRQLIPVGEAFKAIDGIRRSFFSRSKEEYVPVAASLGRRLMSDVCSTRLSPPCDISAMDGYAVRSDDHGPRTIIGEVFAGDLIDHVLDDGEAMYITTGAPMPRNADAVAKIEDVVVTDRLLNDPFAPRWDNVVRAGTDFRPGDVVLKMDTVITPAAIGVLHASGLESVAVYPRIRFAVISTGEEIKNGTIRNSNAPMVHAMLESWGCEHVDLGTIGDSVTDVSEALIGAASEYDAIITIGGISTGKKDPVAAALPEICDILFKGVRIKPGKPVTVSMLGETPIFSLPGKPAGAYTGMEVIVRRFVIGGGRLASIEIPVEMDIDFIAKGYDHIVYICLKDGRALPVGYEGSPISIFTGPAYGTSILSSATRSLLADGFFIASDVVRAGETVRVNIL